MKNSQSHTVYCFGTEILVTVDPRPILIGEIATVFLLEISPRTHVFVGECSISFTMIVLKVSSRTMAKPSHMITRILYAGCFLAYVMPCSQAIQIFICLPLSLFPSSLPVVTVSSLFILLTFPKNLDCLCLIS